MSTIIKEVFLRHPETIKETIRFFFSAAGERRGRELWGWVIFGEPWLGFVGVCVCVVFSFFFFPCMGACIHTWRKTVHMRRMIPVEAAAMQWVTGTPWIIHRAFGTASSQQVLSNCFGEDYKFKCTASESKRSQELFSRLKTGTETSLKWQLKQEIMLQRSPGTQ